jgi:hypothetical protein
MHIECTALIEECVWSEASIDVAEVLEEEMKMKSYTDLVILGFEKLAWRMRRRGTATRESAFSMTLMSGDDTGSAEFEDFSSL